MGELPGKIRERLAADYSLSEYDADVIVNKGRGVVEYYETLAKESGDHKKASNWLQQSVFASLDGPIDAFPVSATALAELIQLVGSGKLDSSRGKDVFAAMLESGKTAAEAVKSLGIEQVDDGALEELVKELLEANPHVVDDVKAGKLKAVGALIGQAKKKNPNVNPNQFRELCVKTIEGM